MADDNSVPALTMETVKDEINRTVTGAVQTLKKQWAQDLSKGLEGSASAIGKMLDEKLSAFRPVDDPADPNDKTGGKGKGKDLQIATLERRLNETTQAIEAANAKASKAESRRRQIERDNQIRAGLQKHGVVDPFKLELALGHIDRNRLADWSGEEEDSSVVWNGQDGVQVGFDDGLAGFAKSEQFKHFLPPRGAGGAGTRPPSRVGPGDNGKKDVSYEDIGNAVLGIVSPLGAPNRLGE